jgi:hypothetical protein
MNIKTLHYSKFASIFLSSAILLLASCKKDNDEPNTNEPEIASTAGVYVICEGNAGRENSTLTFYNVATGTVEKDYYKKVNGTNLGETANDLQRYGSKLYCVLTGVQTKTQSFVDVMDARTGKSIKRISFNANGTGALPRRVAFYNGKAYVSRLDGKVSRIDTASLNIEADVTLGEGLEGVAVANGKLYVANQDYSFMFPNGKNTVVSVVDLNSFTKLKDITTNWNPTKIATAPNGDVYVLCEGDYTTPSRQPALDRISSVTDTKIGSSADYAGYGSFAVGTQKAFITGASTAIRTVDFATGTTNGNFTTDNVQPKIIYGLSVNNFDNDLYVFDALDWISTTGRAYCFGADGKKKFDFETGQLPKAAVFIYNYK